MQPKDVLAIQLALYGVAWLVVAHWLREQRPAALHWAGYSLMQALLAAVTFAVPRALVGLLTVGSLVLAMRGLELFARGRSRLDRLYLLLLAMDLACSGLITLQLGDGPSAALHTANVLSAYAMMTLAALLPLPWLWRGLRPVLGRGPTLLALAPALLVGLWQAMVLVVRLLWGAQGLAQVAWLAPGSVVVSTVATALFGLGGLALVVIRLVRQLQHTARHDHLTGVCNRMETEAVLARSHAQHLRSGRGYAVAMLDLDRFKQINDSHGHGAGDAALVCAARSLSRSARAADLVGRWGGEEFIVVMPEADEAQALEAAGRLLAALRQQAQAELGHALTASVGVAHVLPGDASAEAVVARADAALYRAKAGGRDRVEPAQPGLSAVVTAAPYAA